MNEPFVTRSFQNNDEIYNNEIDLKAETLIYSNYEQTLSFLLQITFKSVSRISKLNLLFKKMMFNLII